MRAPTGTVTFLFTDIEGSTQLLRQLRDGYAQLLAEHHRLLRSVFEARGGDVIDTQGDAFFVAFPRAKDALLAASDAQRALAEGQWPGGVDVRVRMGIHTGEPSATEFGPVGMAVHRAARIAASAHGGQVLLSATTRDLVEDELPAGLRLHDLGSHRLKDIDRPEHLHQLVVDGVPADFSPPRTDEAPPAEATPFAGREEELAAAVSDAAVGRRLALRRPWLALTGALVALAVVGAAVAIALARDDTRSVVPEPNSVIEVDPDSDSVVDSIPVGRLPGPIAATRDALWVLNERDRTLSRVDAESREVRTVAAGKYGNVVADERGSVWVSADQAAIVWRINPTTMDTEKTIRVRSRALGLAAGGGSLWVTNPPVTRYRSATVSRIDLASLEVGGVHPVGNEPFDATFGFGALWVANYDGNSVSVIRPGVADPQTIAVEPGPLGIAAGAGAVWVACYWTSTVMRIDPFKRRVVRKIPLSPTIFPSKEIGDIATGAGAVWVVSRQDRTLVRIDPRTNKVARRIRLPVPANFLTFARGAVWATVAHPPD